MVIVIISTVKPVPDNVTYHGQPQRGNVCHSPRIYFRTPHLRGFFFAWPKHEETPMANPLYLRDIISINDLSRDELELVLNTAAALKQRPQPELLKQKVIASCFFEASTRTRLSFETAIQRLGASVVGFSDSSNTSLGQKKAKPWRTP
ncbi:Aspartate carbamoyltransferase [Morganella morganii]|nr:Aspartate carbamoyltransferase [Morganella morganii]